MQMLGMEYTTVEEDVLDAVAEIANMVIGNFKTTAETHLGLLGLSIPTVIYGLNFRARTAGKEQWIVVPFRSGGDVLDVKICLTPNRGLPRTLSPAVAHNAHH
jgi:chemotaxis protein CheX